MPAAAEIRGGGFPFVADLTYFSSYSYSYQPGHENLPAVECPMSSIQCVLVSGPSSWQGRTVRPCAARPQERHFATSAVARRSSQRWAWTGGTTPAETVCLPSWRRCVIGLSVRVTACRLQRSGSFASSGKYTRSPIIRVRGAPPGALSIAAGKEIEIQIHKRYRSIWREVCGT